jgi:superoxide dismutase
VATACHGEQYLATARQWQLPERSTKEHAFYLQDRNVKADYVKAWWNGVNWADVAARFGAAAHRRRG